MPNSIAAIWVCTAVDGWQKKTLDERISLFQQAVFTASVESKMVAGAMHSLGCVFASPEYTFAAPDAGKTHPAEHVSTVGMEKVRTAVSNASASYSSLLLIPGSTPVKVTESKASNIAVAYHAGSKLTEFGKKKGVGEVDSSLSDTLTFQPGAGHGLFTCQSNTYAVQICKDATDAENLSDSVAVQVVVGAGVANKYHVKAIGGDESDAIKDKHTKVQIVADWGSYGVFAADGKLIRSYKNEIAGKASIYYYKLPCDLSRA